MKSQFNDVNELIQWYLDRNASLFRASFTYCEKTAEIRKHSTKKLMSLSISDSQSLEAGGLAGACGLLLLTQAGATLSCGLEWQRQVLRALAEDRVSIPGQPSSK